MIRIAIHGTGRMAAAITAMVGKRDDVSLLALAGPNSPEWDQSLPWYPTLDRIPEKPDLLIDFTLPQGTLAAAVWCAASGVPLLSGVTGLTADVVDVLNNAAAKVPVLWSPNLSLGVNLVADLAARAAEILDDEVPVAIEDIHHQWKKDAPSGTALMLGQRILEVRGDDHNPVEFSSIRDGETIGEHTITFHMAGEEFTLVHKAHDRAIYALGALDAGIWLTLQAPGHYSAADWLSGRSGSSTES